MSSPTEGFQRTLRRTKIIHLIYISTNFVFVLVVEMMRAFSLVPVMDMSRFSSLIIFFALLLLSLGSAIAFLFYWSGRLKARPKKKTSQDPVSLALSQMTNHSRFLMAFAQAPAIYGLFAVWTLENYILFYALVALTLLLHLFAFPRRKRWENDYLQWIDYFNSRARG